MMSHKERTKLSLIGWREWVGLPRLGISRIKAKVDTGARSSALHAYDIHEFQRDGNRWVRFKVHPIQRDSHNFIETEARILDHRIVRSSNGKSEQRPVIETTVEMLGISQSVELTLTNRDAMGFRMLLGRQAIRRRFVVDAGKSYYGGKPKRKRKKRQVNSEEHPLDRKESRQ